MNCLKEFVYRLRGEYTTERLIKMGMKVGNCYGEEYTLRKNVSMEMRMKQKEELKG